MGAWRRQGGSRQARGGGDRRLSTTVMLWWRTGQPRPRRGDAATGERWRGVDELGEDGGHEALLAHGR
jgi:hypothetical protein